MNIFASLKKYSCKWSQKGELRSFNAEELAAINSAIVTAGDYGNSVCFFMKGGGQCYIPLDIEATVGVGETVDPTRVLLKTLCKEGENDITRVVY